jgi:hypothetical protein
MSNSRYTHTYSPQGTNKSGNFDKLNKLNDKLNVINVSKFL